MTWNLRSCFADDDMNVQVKEETYETVRNCSHYGRGPGGDPWLGKGQWIS
jgi:hypothetical protein